MDRRSAIPAIARLQSATPLASHCCDVDVTPVATHVAPRREMGSRATFGSGRSTPSLKMSAPIRTPAWAVVSCDGCMSAPLERLLSHDRAEEVAPSRDDDSLATFRSRPDPIREAGPPWSAVLAGFDEQHQFRRDRSGSIACRCRRVAPVAGGLIGLAPVTAHMALDKVQSRSITTCRAAKPSQLQRTRCEQ